MICEFGKCIVCEGSTADDCPTCGARKPNDRYTEVTLNLSNGSKLVMACCVDCATTGAVFQADKEEMMNQLKAAWRKDNRGQPLTADREALTFV